MTARRALVTGATGFVGSHLARRLVQDGWELAIIVRPGSDQAILEDLFGRIAVHEHDGSTEGMIVILRETKPDIVFHVASLFLSQHLPQNIEELIRSNVLFGTQLLEAMTESGVHRFINTGTSWQHFESKEYSPVNLYAATKQAFETMLQYYLETSPLHAITLKLFDTYGPHDPRPKLFHLLRNTAMSGELLAMSPGEQLIDLVHVDDVVHAFLLAADRLFSGIGAEHESYAVSSGAPIRLRDLVALYEKVTGATVPVTWGGRPYRQREIMVPWSTGGRLPNWTPKINLAEGIKGMENA